MATFYGGGQLSSSYSQGSPYTGSPYAPVPTAPKSSGGFSLFGWHPSLPNLGGITAIKQLASGFIGLPELGAHVMGDIALGDWHDLNPMNQGTTGANVVGGLASGVENLGVTGASVLGVPGTRYNVGDELLAPALQKANESIPFLEHTDASGDVQGYKPSSWSQRPGGPIVGAVQDISTVAAVAAPIAKVAGVAEAGSLSEAASTAEAARAAEAAGSADAPALAQKAEEAAQAAEQAQARANMARGFAHPYQTMAEQGAKLVESAWQRLNPATVTAGEAGSTAESMQTLKNAVSPEGKTAAEEFSANLKTQLDPRAGAATTLATGTTIYHGQGELAGEAPHTEFWATEPNRAASFGPHGFSDQLTPEELAQAQRYTEDVRAGKVEGYAANDATGKSDLVLPPELEAKVAARAKPQPTSDWTNPIAEIKPGETPEEAVAREKAAMNAQPEPRSKIPPEQPKVGPNGEVGPKTVNPDEVRSEKQAQVEGQAQAARDEGIPGTGEGSVLARMAQRILAPPPAWADRVTEALPDTVNRVLASFHGPIQKWRINQVANDLRRYIEISQSGARNSSMVQQAAGVAADLLMKIDPTITRERASIMIGEEMGAKLDGTAMADQYVKDKGAQADPLIEKTLHDIARRGYDGVPKDLLDKMSPEDRQTFDNSLSHAMDEYHKESASRMKTLLQSTQGARGLEAALLQDDSVSMNPTQLKMYRRAMSDFRREAILQRRGLNQRVRDEAAFARQNALVGRSSEEVDKAVANMGVAERSMRDLHSSVPLGIRDDNIVRVISEIKNGITSGGIIYDVGRAIAALLPDKGYVVPISTQFDVDARTFAANSDAILSDAMKAPKNVDGATYGPGVWAGTDARFRVQPYTAADGTTRIKGEIVMPSWGGSNMPLTMAVTFGEAHRATSIYDIAAGEEVSLSSIPEVQNVFAYYLTDAMNSKSGFASFGRQLEKTASGIDRLPPEAIADELRVWTTVDHSLAMSNPAWEHGTFFDHAAAAFGKGIPTSEALLQTVLGTVGEDGLLRSLTTKEAFDRAINYLGPKEVQDALRWYYDSHDHIEHLYRGKTVTLLDGSQRDAAEVFYDVLAVTSVMASPKQNLGRALSAYGNLHDFYASQRNAMTAAQSLMDRLDKMQPQIVKVVGVGTPEEREVARGLPGVKLPNEGTSMSSKYFDTPELRKLLDSKVSMTTDPKYNVFDILSGRVKLDNVTNAELKDLPVYWKGKPKSLSDDNVTRAMDETQIERSHLAGPAVDRYRAADDRVEQLKATQPEMAGRTHSRGYVYSSQNEDTGNGLNQSREVTPREAEHLASRGTQILDEAKRNARPTVNLTDPAFIQKMYDAVRTKSGEDVGDNGEWGGGTLDTHTGEFHPVGAGAPDKYSVTMRPTKGKGQEPIRIDPGADLATFTKQWKAAVKTWGDRLSWDGAHFGVFNNPEAKGGHAIELDPTMVLDNTHDVEAVGMASRSGGGAFHFPTYKGYWVPHVSDAYRTNDTFAAEMRAAKEERAAALQADPELAQAHEQAIMEYHGSNALAKLRSFRDNLANPAESTQVTLDSVMAQLYGFVSTTWSGGNSYGQRSLEIRQLSDELSKVAGRTVAPHEIQALLWVYAKQYIGRQDYGRLLFHHDSAWHELDSMRDMIKAGQVPDFKTYDPFHDYWEEERGYPEERMAYKAEHGEEPPGGQNALRAHDVMVAQPRELSVDNPNLPSDPNAYKYETRFEIPTETQDKRYNNYHRDVVFPVREAIGRGDIDEAQRLITSWAVKQRRQVEGDAGGAFDIVHAESRATAGQKLEDSAVTAESKLNNPGRTKAARAANDMVPAPRPGSYEKRGDLNELHQSFQGHVRGALLTTPDKTGRLTIKLYQNAALDTLMHESAHLLRQLLPEDKFAEVEAHYPGMRSFKPAERAAAEEKFAEDLMMYIRNHGRVGDTGPLSDVFRRVAATLEEQHAAVLDSEHGRYLPNDVTTFWDNLFHPNVTRPNQVTDPINLQRIDPQGVETKQFPWETDAQFAQRARQYGEARQRYEAAQMKAALLARAQAKADAASRKMAIALQGPNAYEQQAAKYHAHATAILEKLGAQLEDPETHQVPTQWKPMWEAFKQLRKAGEIAPEIADYLDEIPTTFTAVLAEAAKAGFDPTYIPDMTWEQAQRFMFSHIRVGGADALDKEIMASARKENNQVLNKAGLNVRNIELLASGTVAATHELYTNEFVSFVQKYYAKAVNLEPGQTAKIPEGWKAWDPARDFLLTGTDRRGDFVATNAKFIIPEAVDRAVSSMSNRYDHWVFHTLSKVTKPWITYNLMLSPKWYLHVAISNIVRASLEGVGPMTWMKVVKQWKNDELDPAVVDHSITQLANDSHTLVGKTIAEAKRDEGVKAALGEVKSRVGEVHNVVDKLTRAAIFERTLEKTASMGASASREMAITRMYEAAIDYGSLSPLERGMVRSIIPFYPFYKGMVKLLARFPADHPLATVLLMQAGRMHEEYLQDKFGGAVPSAYLGYADIGGLHNFNILDPFINPTHLVDIHQLNTTLNPFVDIMLRDAYNAAEPGTGQPGMDATGQKVTQVNPAQALGQALGGAPFTRLFAQNAAGGDAYGKSPGVAASVGQYLGVPQAADPAKIMATVKKTLGTLPKKGQPGYVAKPHKAHAARKIRSSFHRLRAPRAHRPRRPR